MTLEEACRWQPGQETAAMASTRGRGQRQFDADPRVAQFFAANASHQREEKARWQNAVEKARQRGLADGDESKVTASQQFRSFSKARRNPLKHAEVLLKETSLPFDEIAEITGLDIYEVVGMKLKLRKAA